MVKTKICLLLQNASHNGTFHLDTTISMTTRLLFGHLLLEHINFSHPVALSLNNVPNLKSISMQKKITSLFT